MFSLFVRTLIILNALMLVPVVFLQNTSIVFPVDDSINSRKHKMSESTYLGNSTEDILVLLEELFAIETNLYGKDPAQFLEKSRCQITIGAFT